MHSVVVAAPPLRFDSSAPIRRSSTTTTTLAAAAVPIQGKWIITAAEHGKCPKYHKKCARCPKQLAVEVKKFPLKMCHIHFVFFLLADARRPQSLSERHELSRELFCDAKLSIWPAIFLCPLTPVTDSRRIISRCPVVPRPPSGLRLLLLLLLPHTMCTLLGVRLVSGGAVSVAEIGCLAGPVKCKAQEKKTGTIKSVTNQSASHGELRNHTKQPQQKQSGNIMTGQDRGVTEEEGNRKGTAEDPL